MNRQRHIGLPIVMAMVAGALLVGTPVARANITPVTVSASASFSNPSDATKTFTLEVSNTDEDTLIGLALDISSHGDGTFTLESDPSATSILGSSFRVRTWIDANNAAFGTTTPLQDFTFTSGGGTSDTGSQTQLFSNVLTPSAPFSLTQEIDITLAPFTDLAAHVSVVATPNAVPEPASLGLVVMLALPLALVAGKRKPLLARIASRG